MDLLPNEVFALECIAKYAREGLVVDSSNGQFAHCPYPKPREQKYRLPGDKGYYLLWADHQHQGLIQSVDVGRKCYFTQNVALWLDTKPPGYEELYAIYKKFNARTEEDKKKISEAQSGGKNYLCGRTGALHHSSKAMIAIRPDGTELHFGSINEASRELGLNIGALCDRYLKRGKSPIKGKFKGWRFVYAEQ